MKKIIVCNDTRSHSPSESFPWRRFQEFNEIVNGLYGERRLGSYDQKYPDPLVKYRYIEASPGYPTSNSEIENEFMELSKIANLERESTNVDGLLCKKLREKGHFARIFDAHRLNVITELWTHERDSNRGAADLIEIITEEECDTLIYDLDYFGGPSYGRNMLQMLVQRNVNVKHVIVYSKFLHDQGNTPDDLARDFPSIQFDFVDRFGGGGIQLIARLIEQG